MSEILDLKIANLFEQLEQLDLSSEQMESLRALFHLCLRTTVTGCDKEVGLPHRFWSLGADGPRLRDEEDSPYFKFILNWMPSAGGVGAKVNPKARHVVHHLRNLVAEVLVPRDYNLKRDDNDSLRSSDVCSALELAVYCTGLSIVLDDQRDLFERIYTFLSAFRLPIDWEGETDAEGKLLLDHGKFVCWPLDPVKRKSIYGRA